MSQSTLRLTQFQVEKLRCIGGAGRASPYRITTYRGSSLGAIGPVAEYGWEAVNAEHFESGITHVLKQVWRKLASNDARG